MRDEQLMELYDVLLYRFVLTFVADACFEIKGGCGPQTTPF